ncbi:MAG: hypothetical protein ACREEE_14805, partial [Dongiaceae bacterium]
GSIVPSVPFAGGAVGANLIGRSQPGGTYTLGVLISEEGTPGTKPVDIVNPVKGTLNRLSWRLLQGE